MCVGFFKSLENMMLFVTLEDETKSCLILGHLACDSLASFFSLPYVLERKRERENKTPELVTDSLPARSCSICKKRNCVGRLYEA